jgi:SAM-dependent methyltransferase
MNAFSYEGKDLAVLADMPNYYAWIMSILSQYIQGRVIEYGSGTGTFTERLLPYATSLIAVEPSSNLLPALRARFNSSMAVEIFNEPLESHVVRQDDNSCDTIVMINVLEHIEDDRAALQNLVRILRPGGQLLVFVPALRLLMSKLDYIHGHFRRYHKADLEAKVKAADAVIAYCRYFDVFGAVPWFILNTILGSTRFNPTLVRVNDRYVIPMSRTIERMIRPPLGKNLILVARKPS